MKNYFTTKRITFLAVFTALIMLTTMYISIPNPLLGYTNIGDTFIFLGSMLFGPIFGLISGGIGSMLADILKGYTMYAPFTLVVKGLEGLIVGLLAKAFIKCKLNRHFSVILAMVIAGLFMVVGYFATNAILAGNFLSGFGGVPNDLIQAALSVVLGYILTLILSRINSVNALTDNLLRKSLGSEDEKNNKKDK